MNDLRVTLSATEMMVAAYVGSGRNVQCILNAIRQGNERGPDDMWTPNIEGTCGEMTVAKFLNMFWCPRIGDFDAPDVGPYQVRTNMSRKYTDTCLRQKDKEKHPHSIFISVLSFAPDFEIIGWIGGEEGMQDKWFRHGELTRPKCWYVPRTALHPMETLPSVEEALLLMQGAT